MTSVSKYSSRRSAQLIVQKRRISYIVSSPISEKAPQMRLKVLRSPSVSAAGSGGVTIRSGRMKRHWRIIARPYAS